MGTYNDTLDPDTQITAEEGIAFTLFDYQNSDLSYERPSEDDCAQLSRRILLNILTEFRPDLTSKE